MAGTLLSNSLWPGCLLASWPPEASDLPLRPAASSPGELLGYEIDVGSHKPPANLSGRPGSKRLKQSHLATIYSGALPRSSFITPFSGFACQLGPAQALGLCCL